jgi:putative salt-induced outer membrane protein YdiY
LLQPELRADIYFKFVQSSIWVVDAKGRNVKLHEMIFFLLLFLASLPTMVRGQTPVKKYAGNFGAGFALTGGNTDTTSFNLSFEATRDPKAKNIMKANGLYLRSSANDRKISDQLRLSYRDDYLMSKRITLYGAMAYLRDPFRNISYLLNPQGGVGLRVYNSARSQLSFSVGAGAAWEKNIGTPVLPRGTLNASQSYLLKLSDAARWTQSLTVMRKTQDVADSLYRFDTALVTTVVKKIDVKIQFMDEYKTPIPAIKKNDTALITSLLFKF